MAGEPKKKSPKSRSRTMRAAKKLSGLILVVCKNCGKPIRPHIVCKFCGFYAGKQVGKSKAVVIKA